MIGITIAGRHLVLFPSTAIDIEFITSAMEDEIADDHSLPFEVPRAGNEEVLQFATELGVHRRQVEFRDAMLWYHGVPRRPGVIYIEEVGDDSVQLSFSVEGYVSLTRGKRLPELFLPPPIETGGIKAHAKAINEQSYPAAGHCFPMYHAPEFYGSKNPAWWPDAPQWEYERLYNANDKVTHWFGQYLKVPLGFISLQNGNVGIEPNDEHPLWWARTAYGIVNHWDWDEEEFLVNTTDVALYTLSPVFYLKYILQQAFATLGLQVGGSWFNDARYDRLVLFNQHPLDSVARSKYFRVSQVGSITWTPADNIATRRLPAHDESTFPNEDDDNLWNDTEMVFYPGEAGMWTFRCWVPPVIPAGSYITVHLYRWWPGLGYILVDVRTYTEANIAAGWDGLTSIDIDVEAGQLAAGYYWAVGYGPNQPITITGAWVDGWKHSVVLNNVPSDTIVPQEHVPDIALDELLLDLKAIFGLKVIPDLASGTISLNYAQQDITTRTPVDITAQVRGHVAIDVAERKPGIRWQWPSDEDDQVDLSKYVLQGEYESIADVPAPLGLGYYCVVKADQRVYTSALGVSTAYLWFPAGYLPKETVVGDAERAEERTPAVRPARPTIVSVQDQLFQVPFVPGRGSSKYYGEGASTTEPHLAFFHGMRPNQEGHAYPFASDLRYRMDGQPVGDADLDWSQLVPSHQEALAETWVGADPIVFDLQLHSLEQLNTLITSPLVHIQGQRCLLLRIPVQLTMDHGPLLAKGCRAIKLLNA